MKFDALEVAFSLLLFPVILGMCKIDNSPYGINSNVETNNNGTYPYFDLNGSRNITTAVGKSAFLPCQVHQIGDKSVSWIRQRDLHILTAGLFTYTSDQRFQVINADKSDLWTLHIKFPQFRDSGIYECQLNTEPKMSLQFTLNVVESKAAILGDKDVYVKVGSPIMLECTVNQGPHDLGNIFWLKNEDPALQTEADEERILISAQWNDVFASKLQINHAILTDNGNYTCVPTSSAEPATVFVHVVSGEHPAAMQHGNSSTNIIGGSVKGLVIYCVGMRAIFGFH